MIKKEKLQETLAEVLGLNGKPFSAVCYSLFAGNSPTLADCYRLVWPKLSKEFPSGTKSDKQKLDFHLRCALREQYDDLADSCPSGDMDQGCYFPIFTFTYTILLHATSTWNAQHNMEEYKRLASYLYIDRMENGVVQERISFTDAVMAMVYLKLIHSEPSIKDNSTKLIQAIEDEYSSSEVFQYFCNRVWGFSSVFKCKTYDKEFKDDKQGNEVFKLEQILDENNATKTQVQEFSKPQQTIVNIGHVGTLNTNPNIFPNQQPFYNQR